MEQISHFLSPLLTAMSSNSSFSSAGQYLVSCKISVVSQAVFMSFFFSYIFFLPLFIFVLWQLSHRRSASVETRDPDVFTFQIVLLQIFGVVAILIFCYGAFSHSTIGVTVGYNIFSSIAPGETMFHVLTCLERYLAVVNPVTYRGLRQSGRVRIRNICIGSVWLLCFAVSAASINQLFSIIITFLMLILASVTVTFCSISVLFVLIRPGPGEVGGIHKRMNRTKQKAFYTIVVILTTLIVRFLSYLVYTIIFALLLVKNSDPCLVFWSVNWFSLPSILVLPLLFLHRIGKLPQCRHNSADSIRKLQHTA